MGYRAYFMFASGLSETIRVEMGTFQRMMEHVDEIESELGLERESHDNNLSHWTSKSKRFEGIPDEKVCLMVSKHNRYVRWFYDMLDARSKSPTNLTAFENLTPKKAQQFWHALELLSVEPFRWTKDFYREEMDRLYEAMRGRETDGVSFNAKKPLTIEQADAVICLFSEYLDKYDIRLAVPRGHDSLASSYDGEYYWSSTCGAVAEDDIEGHARTCIKKDCDVRNDFADK